MGGIKIYLTAVLLLVVSVCNAQNVAKLLVKDFNNLEGDWKGNLTYLDYFSGKPYTMQADVKISRLAKTGNYIFLNLYPKESNANSLDTLTIASDGKFIGIESVKSRTALANGIIQIVTEEIGIDGNENKKAILKHTYTFGKETFSKRKDVQFLGETQWIKRHEYLYHKISK